jgi:hypothetical protein
MQNQNNLTPIEGYTVDHDVLTDKGWIPISEVKKESKVATLINRTRLEYHNPSDVKEYDCDEEIYEVDTTQINVSVTKNHNMWVKKRDKDYFNFISKDIFGKRIKYKKNVNIYIPNNWIGNTFILPNPNRNLEMNSWLKFFGIWISEGWTYIKPNKAYRVYISSYKERVMNEMDKIMNVLGFHIQKNETEHKWIINDKQLTLYLDKYSVGAKNKYLPKWVWKLNRDQCKILIDGLMLGDGHIRKTGSWSFDTSSIKLANDISKLCLHAGYCGNVYKTKDIGPYIIKNSTGIRSECYKTSIIKKLEPEVNIYKNIEYDRYIKYTGKIYSCTMPNNEPIYIRKNGKPVWC